MFLNSNIDGDHQSNVNVHRAEAHENTYRAEHADEILEPTLYNIFLTSLFLAGCDGGIPNQSWL